MINSADEQMNPASRRGRFIAPIADLSALGECFDACIKKLICIIPIQNQQQGEAMDTGANKALVRRYVELYNTGNVALADEVLLDRYNKGTRTERVQIKKQGESKITPFTIVIL